jgi:invasion protein IalB
MMTISSRAAAAAVASLFLASSAFAQTTAAPATSKPAATTPAKKAETPRSPESIACSKQADEKGLHGKERHKFRSQCIKDAKAAAPSK